MPHEINEEIYTHKYLWASSEKLLNVKNDDELFYRLLPSLLLSFMAYEAFVNFLGQVLLPERWDDERSNFKGKTLEGKLDEIIEQKLPDFEFNKGSLPYQNIKKLESFRNLVSHGKVISNKYSISKIQTDGSHFSFEHPWDEFLKADLVTEFRNNIKTFCQSIVKEARKVSDHSYLNYDAFEGSLARAQGRTVK